MVQVDLEATSPSTSLRSMTSRAATPMMAPPPPLPVATRSSLPFKSRKCPVLARLSKRWREWKPKRAFHCAEKLKACCVNNEAESIGTSGGSFSMFAHRNIVLSLSWQIYKMSCLHENRSGFNGRFFDGGWSRFSRSEKIEEAYYFAKFNFRDKAFLWLMLELKLKLTRRYLKNNILLFLYIFYWILLDTFFRLRDRYFLALETAELYFLCEILFRHDPSRNLSRYPAAVDGPNEFLPPFSREREFAILVDDTAERSPEGRFNFANLAGSSCKICIATLELCQCRFPDPRPNSRMLFGCPIPTVLMERHIRAI